jgi:hypothetical protein
MTVCWFFYFAQTCLTKSSWLHFSIEENSPNTIFVKFLWLSLRARRFSIRILLFGEMELDLPKPVSNPLSQISRPGGHRAYPLQKYIGKYKKNYQNLAKTLFYIKQKSEKGLTNSLWATLSSSSLKINVFTSPMNSVSTKSFVTLGPC